MEARGGLKRGWIRSWRRTWRRKLEEEMEEELGEELEEEPGIPDLKNIVPCAIIVPTLQPQEAQCYQTLRLCILERAGRTVSLAIVEPNKAEHT